MPHTHCFVCIATAREDNANNSIYIHFQSNCQAHPVSQMLSAVCGVFITFSVFLFGTFSVPSEVSCNPPLLRQVKPSQERGFCGITGDEYADSFSGF